MLYKIYASSLLKVAIIMTFFSKGSMLFSVVPLIPRTLLLGNPERTNPKISPDGTQFAYCAPFNGVLNVWVKSFDKDDASVITKEKKRGIQCYGWSPDGKRISYLQDENGDENFHLYSVDLTTNITKDLTPFPNVRAMFIAQNKQSPHEMLINLNKENQKLFDAYHLNSNTGVLTLIEKNPGNVIKWIADKNLQIRAAQTINPDGTQQLLVKKNKEDQWHVALQVDREDALRILGFSSDDTSLYIMCSYGINTSSLMHLDLITKKLSIIFSDNEYDIDHVIFNENTHEPEVVFCQKERMTHELLDRDLKEDFNRICAISKGDLVDLQKSFDGMKWILEYSYDNKSSEYYLYDRKLKKSSLLFCKMPELNNYELASMQPISFVARDGLKIHGYLTIPVEQFAKNLPLVLYVHGGPHLRNIWGYHFVVQLLANRGCAVLEVNYRGSSGYGKKFLAAGHREWGGKMHDDLIDAVQWAIDQGIADPKKIAIMGGSYGGYAALVGATLTPDIFCCAIDAFGPSNLITFITLGLPYCPLAEREKSIGKLGDKDFLKSRSPLFHVDNIKIPILIAHGVRDARVQQCESEQIVEAMTKKGINHTYLLFPDEGHGFKRPQNRLTFYTAVERFLAQYLGTRFEI